MQSLQSSRQSLCWLRSCASVDAEPGTKKTRTTTAKASFHADCQPPRSREHLAGLLSLVHHQLPQKTWWQHIILDLSKKEPVLAHAATALGSMHRAIAPPGDCKELSVNTDQRQIATDQYTKAVALMRRYIDECFRGDRVLSQDQLVVVLLACLLFFCFEAYVGHDEQASLHLRTGSRVLYEQRRDLEAAQTRDAGDRVITTRAHMRSYLDALTYTFVLLDNDLNMVDEEERYV